MCEEVHLGKLFLSVWVFTATTLYLVLQGLFEVALFTGTIGLGMGAYFYLCSSWARPIPQGVSGVGSAVSIILNLVSIIVSILQLIH